MKKKRWDVNSYERNKDRLTIYRKEWRQDNHEYDLARKHDWYVENRDKDLERKRRRYRHYDPYNEAYDAFLNKYGRVCSICGFDKEPALQCEHVDGGGTEQRRTNNRIRLLRIFVAQYDYWKDKIRVTCANCNIRLERMKIQTMTRDAIYRYGVAEKLRHILGQFVCQDCGEHDKRVLTFHHIDDDGNEDRNRFGPAEKWWKYYVSDPELARTKICILCYNCQFIRKAKIKMPIFCLKV